MAQEKIDWIVLRGAVGVFAICLLLSGLLLGASSYFRDEMETEYRNHHARFRDVSRKYLAVDEEERIIEQTYPEFVQLYESGILGPEHRLNWIESLRTAGERLELPDISYRVNSQLVYTPEYPLNLGAFNVHTSEMQLSLGLLHEGDLQSLFNALDRDAKGLYSISRCAASRINEQSEFDPTQPMISATCQLNWYTVDLKGERKLSL